MYLSLLRRPERRRPPSVRALIPAVFALVMLSGFGAEGAEAPAGDLNSPEDKIQAFVPPPRTISDITAILDAQKLDVVERSRMRRHLKMANRKPPKDAGRTKLARFYMKRGKSARRIGRVRQSIDDLTKANALGTDLPSKHRHRILQMLGQAEYASGDRAKGIRYIRQAIEITESEAQKISDTARLSRMLESYGNLEEVKRLLADATRRMDRLRRATGGRLARQWRQSGDKLQGRVARARGNVLITAGLYAEAEAAIRSTITHFSRFIATSKRNDTSGRNLRNHAQVKLASVLSLQGRHKEAEVEARIALLDVLKTHGRYNRRTAARTRSLAKIVRAQGRPQEAETLLRASLEISGKIGTKEGSRYITNARGALADTLAHQGRWAEALQQFDAIKAASAHDPVRLAQRILTNPSYALALIRNGRPSEALAIARRAVARQLKLVGKDHQETAGAQGILAMALTALGRDRDALVAFTHATSRLLAADHNQSRWARDWRTKLILESHMTLLARLRGTALVAELGFEPTAEAFRIADTLRGQGVQRALNASAARASAGSPGLAELVRREQDTANRIGALTALHANVLSRPTDQQDMKARKTLQTSIARLQGEYNTLMAQTAKRFPAYAALMAPRPPTIARARKSLRPDEALIATYVGERESYIWAVPKTGPVAFAVVPSGRARIAAKVAKLRLGIRPTGKTLDTVPKFDVKTAHDLYLALLAPVAAGWKDATDLLVVAHGPLGQVPFSVLVTRETVVKDGWSDLPFAAYRRVPWLARSHGVTALPTVAALITLRKLAPAAGKKRAFAGFADPWFSQAQAEMARSQAKQGPVLANLVPASGLNAPILLRSSPDLGQRTSATLADLKRLPDTAREVRSIARALKAELGRDVFIGPRANEHSVKTMDLSRYKVIAFASHALLPGSLDGLTQPALAMTAPDVAGIEGDGLLTMGEILGLKLDADWVVLSACNTAAANGAGAEAVSGLGRAFLYAGTRSLLITHWPIESRSARSLVTDLFKRQAADTRLSRTQALRQAKLGLIDGPGFVDAKGRTVYAYAHPLFWAPFQLFGEGAASSTAM